MCCFESESAPALGWLALLAWPVPTLYLLLLLLLLRLMLLLRSLLSTPVLIAVGEDAAFVAALLLSLLLAWLPLLPLLV